MRKTILLTFVLFVTAFSSKAGGSKDTLVIQTKIYCDHCVQCETCWPQIEHELLYTKGVKYVWFDDKAMTISVVYNTKKTNPDLIRQSVANAGFDADHISATPEGVARLDGCCKKKG